MAARQPGPRAHPGAVHGGLPGAAMARAIQAAAVAACKAAGEKRVKVVQMARLVLYEKGQGHQQHAHGPGGEPQLPAAEGSTRWARTTFTMQVCTQVGEVEFWLGSSRISTVKLPLGAGWVGDEVAEGRCVLSGTEGGGSPEERRLQHCVQPVSARTASVMMDVYMWVGSSSSGGGGSSLDAPFQDVP
jgi:hypothetical protein